MGNNYTEMMKRHQQEVNDFPIGFAFNDQQFKEAMEELGLSVDDTHLVTSTGAGGFIRKSDAQEYVAMFERQEKERRAAINDDPTGDGFIYNMFSYEISNHEGNVEDALEALDIEPWEVNESERLKYGFKRACKEWDE